MWKVVGRGYAKTGRKIMLYMCLQTAYTFALNYQQASNVVAMGSSPGGDLLCRQSNALL